MTSGRNVLPSAGSASPASKMEMKAIQPVEAPSAVMATQPVEPPGAVNIVIQPCRPGYFTACCC